MSSHNATDSGMYKMMLLVMGALTVLTLLIMITARALSSGSNDEYDALLNAAMLERIAPSSRVRTDASALAQPVMAAADRTGEQLANGTCAACHASGAGGAPLFSAKAEWESRAAGGLDALVSSVVNGKGGMPARGGSDYTDDEIIRAVEWMIGVAPDEAAANTSAAPAEETQVATAETDATAAVATGTETETETAAAEPTDEGVVAALTPRIKNTIDAGVCSGCHLSGVANAPKYGDADEWAKRAENGFAAMAQSVVNGKGAMPPRGGSDLTDDELLIAVEYMTKKGS